MRPAGICRAAFSRRSWCGEFARYAGDGDWESLDDAVRGADMPVLSGLRHILEREIKLKDDDAPLRRAVPPPSVLWCRPCLGCA